MQTLREKISFILTGLAYMVFHLALDPDSSTFISVNGTIVVLLNTLPYEIGFTYIITLFIRRLSKNQWPPWDRIMRIFFTIGIIFGLIYGLYVRGAIEEERRKTREISATRLWEDDTPRQPWYWA